MRLFIAIALDEDLRAVIGDLQDTLVKVQSGRGFSRSPASSPREQGIKLVEEENIHLTLRFLGDISEEQLESLQKAIAVVENYPCFELHLKELGAFPNERNPKVVWVGCGGSKTLMDLYQSLENSLLGLGLPPDDHRFSAHITIGRNKFPTFSPPKVDLTRRRGSASGTDNSFQSFMTKNAGVEIGRQQVKQVTLFQSTLTSTGPIYTIIREFKLKE